MSNVKQTIVSLKKSCSLFSQMYISCQVRNDDMKEFFRYENQTVPPSISSFGNLRSGTKSDLLHSLQNLSSNTIADERPLSHVVLLDGAAIVNMLKPGPAKTFLDYSTEVFVPYIKSQLSKSQWDDICGISTRQTVSKLQAELSEGRTGTRTRVLPDTNLETGKTSLE